MTPVSMHYTLKEYKIMVQQTILEGLATSSRECVLPKLRNLINVWKVFLFSTLESSQPSGAPEGLSW